jgi:hypothetical protein
VTWIPGNIAGWVAACLLLGVFHIFKVVFLVSTRNFVAAECVSGLKSVQEEAARTNLSLLAGRVEDCNAAAGVRCIADREDTESFAGTGGPFAVLVASFGFCCCSVEYFCKRSPILSLRNDTGIRLTRISIRVRRLCA